MKIQIIEDDDFGQLMHKMSDLWYRNITINQFGRTWDVYLYVDVDEQDGIEVNQREAFRTFSEGALEFLERAESEMRQYSNNHGINRAEMEAHVRPTSVTFPYARYKPTFGILYDVSWDESHGAAVKFVDGKFDEVGLQDIIL